MVKDKITTRQLFIIYILITISPAIRLFPAACSKYGHTAGWLAPVIGAFIPAAIITVLSALYKKRDLGCLGSVYEAVFGKAAGKALLAVYLIWTLLLFVLYVRYYAERIVSSLFTWTQPDFFIIAMLVLVFFTAKGKLAPMARFSEFTILIFAAVFFVFFLSLLPTFKAVNVFPVAYYDALPVLRSAYPIVSVWGSITFLFFLGDDITGKENIKKHGRNTVLILAPATAIMIFIVAGSLGPDAAARMPFPFLKVSKLIDIMQSFDRFESVMTSVWMIADFVLIAVFVFVISAITKKLFNMRESKYLTGPVIMLGYAGSLIIAADRYELERFSDSPLTHGVSLLLCLIIPVAALAAGRLRRKL